MKILAVSDFLKGCSAIGGVGFIPAPFEDTSPTAGSKDRIKLWVRPKEGARSKRQMRNLAVSPLILWITVRHPLDSSLHGGELRFDGDGGICSNRDQRANGEGGQHGGLHPGDRSGNHVDTVNRV
jgi:hypothetical protein